jgi:hypothetical protein
VSIWDDEEQSSNFQINESPNQLLIALPVPEELEG